MEMKSFVAIDLETTGLDFEKDEIIEVALVRFENGVQGESVDYLVKPTSVTLRPFIESLTGISNADLENAEPFAAVAQKIYSFIGDLPIVAHNAMFDSKFLKQTFAKVGMLPKIVHVREPSGVGFTDGFAHCLPGCAEPPPRYLGAGAGH